MLFTEEVGFTFDSVLNFHNQDLWELSVYAESCCWDTKNDFL